MYRYLGAAVSLLFLAVFSMPSMRIFCGRYYHHLCAVYITSVFVVDTVSVKLTGGDRLAVFCHALICAS